MIENSDDASRFAEIASLLRSTDPTDLSKARALTRGVLDEITSIIFEEFFRRQHLMGAIASSKREGEPILQLQREFEVISSAQQKATEAGEDANYAAMLMWLITASAKEKQRQILNRDSVFVPEVIDPLILRNNAISLRNAAAASYEDYGSGFDSTKLSRIHEINQIKLLARGMSNKGHAVTLQSADGTIGRVLVENGFTEVIGFDISEEMVRVAQEKKSDNESYEVNNLDGSIPLGDESTDLVVADFGAASELSDNLITEVSRILRPGGKAYLSYYNKEAFAHTWWQPWQTSVEAVLNPLSDVLEVPLINKNDGTCKSFKIYARGRTHSEIESESANLGLIINSVSCFPLLFTMMPPAFFTDEKRTREAMEYDESHGKIPPYKGYYLNVVIQKP